MLTQKRLKEVLHYDPETGVFIRLIGNGTNMKTGDVAGGYNAKGYIQIRLDRKRYAGHRLAWFYVYGTWPADQLDHKNGIRADNWIANLREATHRQNQQNQKKAMCNNKSGFLGVIPDRKKWRASIQHYGKKISIGTFPTPELAHAAYVSAKRDLHPFGEI